MVLIASRFLIRSAPESPGESAALLESDDRRPDWMVRLRPDASDSRVESSNPTQREADGVDASGKLYALMQDCAAIATALGVSRSSSSSSVSTTYLLRRDPVLHSSAAQGCCGAIIFHFDTQLLVHTR